jgi:pyrroloquinoline quinone biosynthesis protein E
VRPYTLVAELTYRCPLACPYCSNPAPLDGYRDELSTDEWRGVLDGAEALGVVQVHLSGGEPLVRRDLAELIAHARRRDLYTNLITSGVPVERERLAALRDAGLDHVQLSLQDVDAESAARIAGLDALAQKREVARWTKELGLPLTLNIVLHRANLDRVAEMVAFAEAAGADRLELANTQYHGWALANRDALLPEAAQLERARAVAVDAAARLRGRMEIVYVKPDYFGDQPKACMDGWARRFLVVAPDGTALPCHAARSITSLSFENVRDRGIESIWRDSEAFNRFRGESWMPEPCKSCDRRAVDFGGCRCQAFALTGDAAATDPACALSPHHQLIQVARASRPWTPRRY